MATEDTLTRVTLPGINDPEFNEEANFVALQQLRASDVPFYAVEGWTNCCKVHTKRGPYELSFTFGREPISKKKFQSINKIILENVGFELKKYILFCLEEYKKGFENDVTFPYDSLGRELTDVEFREKISGMPDEDKVEAWAKKMQCAVAHIARNQRYKEEDEKEEKQREKEHLEKVQQEKANEERRIQLKKEADERQLQLIEEQRNDALLRAMNGLLKSMDR
jgi:hypothetical protein